MSLLTAKLPKETYPDYLKFMSLLRFAYQCKTRISLDVVQTAMSTAIANICEKDAEALFRVLEKLPEEAQRAATHEVRPEVYLVLAYHQISDFIARPRPNDTEDFKKFMNIQAIVIAEAYDKPRNQVYSDLVETFKQHDAEFQTFMLECIPVPGKELH